LGLAADLALGLAATGITSVLASCNSRVDTQHRFHFAS
jgi:hypothetical protein